MALCRECSTPIPCHCHLAQPVEIRPGVYVATDDPVEATRTVHETEGTFWRRLSEDGHIVLLRI